MQTSTTRINTSYRISHFALTTFGTTFAFSHCTSHFTDGERLARLNG